MVRHCRRECFYSEVNRIFIKNMREGKSLQIPISLLTEFPIIF